MRLGVNGKWEGWYVSLMGIGGDEMSSHWELGKVRRVVCGNTKGCDG